jgi:hypothetical protein
LNHRLLYEFWLFRLLLLFSDQLLVFGLPLLLCNSQLFGLLQFLGLPLLFCLPLLFILPLLFSMSLLFS